MSDAPIRRWIIDTFELAPEQLSLGQPLQSLWSGYGQITRYHLNSKRSELPASVVVKAVQPPVDARTDHAHARKLRSYQVEGNWYQHWAPQLPSSARTARSFGYRQRPDQQWLLLEDLDAAGFNVRLQPLEPDQVRACLAWLARLHGHFIRHNPPKGWCDPLWSQGSYWHLATRPLEWAAMPEGELKAAAPLLDKALHQCQFQTLLHGDAKVDNFCFKSSGTEVAAVDFQYVGAGCGMKDVIYLLDSALSAKACAEHTPALLDHYFTELHRAAGSKLNPEQHQDLEYEWRRLVPLAWADFERFMSGWAPGHRPSSWAQTMIRHALVTLALD